MVKCTGPVMVEQVLCSVSRCTVPSCSRPTLPPAWRTVLPRSHLGGLTEGMEVSHSNQAGAGSITVTSCRPRTMVMDCSVDEELVTSETQPQRPGSPSYKLSVPSYLSLPTWLSILPYLSEMVWQPPESPGKATETTNPLPETQEDHLPLHPIPSTKNWALVLTSPASQV